MPGPAPRAMSLPAVVAVLAGLLAVAVPAPAPAAPAQAPPPGAGPRSRVVLVGDSIMEGAVPQLRGAFALAGIDAVVDAETNRSTAAGARVLSGLLDVPADAVVVMLGANDARDADTYRADVEHVLAAAAAVPRVYWIAVPEVRGYYPAANLVLLHAASQRPGMQVLAWNGVTEADAGLTVGDGLHLTPAGGDAMAAFVSAAVAADLAAAAVPSTTVPSTTVPSTTVPSTTVPSTATVAAEPAPAASEPVAVASRVPESAGAGDVGGAAVLTATAALGLILGGLLASGVAVAVWALWRTRACPRTRRPDPAKT